MRIQNASPLAAVLPQRATFASAPVAAVEAGVDPVKADLIGRMIRVAPDERSEQELTRALSRLPNEALVRLLEFGTKFEVYDRNASDLPLYAKHLNKPNLMGAYSPTANVVFVDQNNITPLVLLHETCHALDAALGMPSQAAPWTSARDESRASRACIRPYATHNSAEYFADNLAAHLIPESDFVGILRDDLKRGAGTQGMTKEQFLSNHVNYSRERQAKADPLAHRLCSELLGRLSDMPSASPQPALSPEEYYAVKVAELKARRAAQAA